MNENGKFDDLFGRFCSDRLRTVSNFREMMAGATDIKIEIELKDDSCERLTFPAPWDGKFYCYYRTDSYKNEDRWYINDWGAGKCLLMKETGQLQTKLGFVKTDDVLQLLEDCRRIPAQRTEY